MGFIDAIKSGFNKYIVFSTRSRRSEYWWWTLFAILANLLLGWIPIVGQLLSLAIAIPGIAVSVRRLHDIDRSGWWLLAPLVPAIALIAGAAMELEILTIIGGLAVAGVYVMLLVWFCSEGTKGPNRFGDDPKNPVNVGEVFS